MDDTTLGRPPRHARPKKKNRDAKALSEALPEPAAGEMTRVRGKRACTGCGEDFTIDVSGPEDGMLVQAERYRLSLDDPECDSCREARWDAEERAGDDRVVLEHLRTRLRVSGIPTRWRGGRWEDLEADDRRDVISAARDWAEGRRNRGLLLHGEVGRGKTLIGAIAAVHRLALGHVRWLTVPDLMMDLRMPFAAPEYARAQRALQPGFRTALVLDDLDKVRPTEMQLQPLYVAVNGWLEADLPLIVTMNRNLDALADWFGESFGEAIASRLAGHCDVFEVAGRDRRLDP